LTNKQCHKVKWWSIEKYSSNRAGKVYFGNFGYFKGHNSKGYLTWARYFANKHFHKG